MKENPHRTTISFKADAETRDRIDRLSRESGRTRSKHVMDAVSLYLDLRESFHASDLEFSSIMKKILDTVKEKKEQ